MQNLSPINFNGQFKFDKLKPKQAKKLDEILTTKSDGESNVKLLKKMPFDVDVVCLNPSKRAINPRFRFWITKTKDKATLEGNIRLTTKNSVEENVLKLKNFLINFHNRYKTLKGDERLTRAEETQRQFDFILFGKY